jgi:hypothetical protein
MTADLSPDTRRMLAGVLGMLGSDHVGERDVTARLAEWIVRSAGLTWNGADRRPAAGGATRTTAP